MYPHASSHGLPNAHELHWGQTGSRQQRYPPRTSPGADPACGESVPTSSKHALALLQPQEEHVDELQPTAAKPPGMTLRSPHAVSTTAANSIASNPNLARRWVQRNQSRAAAAVPRLSRRGSSARAAEPGQDLSPSASGLDAGPGDMAATAMDDAELARHVQEQEDARLAHELLQLEKQRDREQLRRQVSVATGL